MPSARPLASLTRLERGEPRQRHHLLGGLSRLLRETHHRGVVGFGLHPRGRRGLVAGHVPQHGGLGPDPRLTAHLLDQLTQSLAGTGGVTEVQRHRHHQRQPVRVAVQGRRRPEQRDRRSQVVGASRLTGEDARHPGGDQAERPGAVVGHPGRQLGEPTRQSHRGRRVGEVVVRVHGVGEDDGLLVRVGGQVGGRQQHLAGVLQAAGASRDLASQGQLVNPPGVVGTLTPVGLEQAERPLGQAGGPGRLGRRQQTLGPARPVRGEPAERS